MTTTDLLDQGLKARPQPLVSSFSATGAREGRTLARDRKHEQGHLASRRQNGVQKKLHAATECQEGLDAGDGNESTRLLIVPVA